MTKRVENPGLRLLVLFLWILLAFFYSSLAYNYIVASDRDGKLEEYLQYVVVLCGDDHRPAKEVRTLVLAKASQLNIDLRPDQVNVSGFSQTLKIEVNYSAEIRMPIFQRSIYTKIFSHESAYRNIR